MSAPLERQRDLAGGALIAAIGLGFLVFGLDIPRGDAFRMGPGYFPTVLSGLLLLLGLVLMGRAWAAAPRAGTFSGVPWQSVLLVTGAIVVFGLCVRGLGLAPTAAATVLLAARASARGSWRSSLMLAVGVAAGATLLFVWGLGLPLRAFGPWLDF